MSDLRELSDLHSDHQVRFANADLSNLYRDIDDQQQHLNAGGISPLPTASVSPVPTPPAPHVNMDLNSTSHFLSAMEFSISKTHHTLPPEPAPTVVDPALIRSLEQIEEICADLDDNRIDDEPSHMNDPASANATTAVPNSAQIP